MDIESVLRESRAEKLSEPLGFVTNVGKERFNHQLRKITPNIGALQRRQNTILELRKTSVSLDPLFEEIHSIEPVLQGFFEKTEVEKNSYEQLLFSGWPSLQVLNTVPFLLLALSIFKQYVVPLMAVLTPLLMIVMPFFFLKYVYNLPITVDQYMKIAMKMFGLDQVNLQNPRTILQGSLTLFSIGQSIYQPIQNALHLQTVHAELMKKAEASQRFVVLMEQLVHSMPSSFKCKNPLKEEEGEDAHRLFASFWDSPLKVKLALQLVGDCEVVWRLAQKKEMKPVVFVRGSMPCLIIEKGKDPFLPDSIPYDLSLSNHALLTGPNRGGKSSVLRSTLLSVVMAQVTGFAFCDMRLRPFDWMATGLRLEDRPGSKSMFESEVDFAIQILQRAEKQPEKVGFVLFDELFHSTNPPDGARTADIFLQKLWLTKNTASFISTHVFALAKNSHKSIQKLCVPAHLKEDGSLHFTYTLQKGICEVSSVDEILKEKGLLAAEKQVSENPPK